MTAQVTIYVKQTCPYCVRAKQLLDKKGVNYHEIDVLIDPAAYTEVKQRTGHQTVPQIFINDQFIGGCDNLYALERDAKLDALLA